MQTTKIARINLNKIKIHINSLPKEIHEIWLRDHCRCPKCFHPITKQRLNATNFDSKIKTHTQRSTQLLVEWDDGHKSSYPYSLFEPMKQVSKTVLWDKDLKPEPTPYEMIMESDEGMKHWLNNISIFGLGFVSGVPKNVEKTKELAEKISCIRHTHYGGFWDFTADLQHGDTAYTDIALGAHTDTTYFTDPIG
jgi:trimethyllysine dioxygenase